MRALIICAVLFAVVVIFVFSSSGWLSGFFSKLLSLSDNLPEITADDVSNVVNEVSRAWKEGKAAVLLFFDKEETDNIDGSINKLIGAVKNMDEKEYTAAVNELRFEIRRMMEMLRIKFENVF